MIVRSTITCKCEVWSTTTQVEQQFKTFENKVLRTIKGPVYDDVTNFWHRRKNKELRENTRDNKLYKRAKALMVGACQTERSNKQNQSNHGLATRKEETKEKVKQILNRWNEDLEKLEITNWDELVQDRENWRALTEMAKTLTEL